jgi:hypothetical protein
MHAEIHEPWPRESATSLVREIAHERGVSERTVWRWIARARAAGSPLPLERLDRHCDYCETPLPETATARRRFCDDICRVYFNRVERPATAIRASGR